MNFENNPLRVCEKGFNATVNATMNAKVSQTIIGSLMLITMFFVLTMSVGTAQAGSLPDFTELVEKHSAAVVNISTTQKMQHPKMNRMPRGMPEQIPEGPLGDLFRHFFGDPRGGFGGPEEHGAPGGPNGDPIEAKSLGSGFIISKDGYVMTNHHVVKDASEILVRLSDRRELVAEVIGSDERSDIALLKVEADHLPVVEIPMLLRNVIPIAKAFQSFWRDVGTGHQLDSRARRASSQASACWGWCRRASCSTASRPTR